MSESARIYCRSRCIFSWEPPATSVMIKGSTIINNVNNRKKAYQFTQIFNENCDNEQCFNGICRPLITNVLDGHNAVLIAYGQTGSGKTHTLVGKPKDNVLGLLPRTLNALFDVPSVTKIELSVTEAYGVHVARIEIFDLLADSSVGTWAQKK